MEILVVWMEFYEDDAAGEKRDAFYDFWSWEGHGEWNWIEIEIQTQMQNN